MADLVMAPPATTAEPSWRAIERELTARGWEIRAREVWAIEARRGGDFEEVLGTSREQAYARLRELLRAHEAAHLP